MKIFKRSRQKTDSENQASNALKVAEFYDKNHEAFIKVYGDVIQAFRTNNLTNLLEYQFKEAGFNDGDTLLDAGCGVCGPAIHFAKNKKVKVDAITISQNQYEEGLSAIEKAGVSDSVQVVCGDYHKLSSHFDKGKYDGVYFLESFGHSNQKKVLIDQVWEVLKPGGCCYIKDLFLKEAIVQSHKEKIEYEVGRINEAYCYNISDLYEILQILRQKGFILNYVKTVDLDLDDFENLAISNEFQELTGIATIENWEEYIFPVDFFEIKITKPIHDLSEGLNKYFLQNLYYMQVKGLSSDEL